MKQEDSQFLSDYEDKLMHTLMVQFTNAGFLAGELLAAEELDERWTTSAPEYMAAAVPTLNDYPSVAVAWAAYMGIGCSILWDKEWEKYADTEDLYTPLATPRGFDAMDEYVVEELLGYSLESEQNKDLEALLRNGARTALTMIRKEGIEEQSVMAFYIFARTAKVMYRLGVAVGMRLLGYRYEKMNLPVS